MTTSNGGRRADVASTSQGSDPHCLCCLRVIAPHVVAGVLALGVLMASRDAAAQGAATPPVVDVGLGRGVTIRTVDDQASLNVRARIQVRSTVVDGPRDAETTTEMLVRRARLVFQGNAAGPAWTYYVQLSFANLDNEADLRLPLRDAYVTWSGGRGLNVRVGQMKVPFSRQRVVSSSALQMVDRSIVVSELNLDRDVGVQAFSKDLFGLGRLGYAVGVFGGEGRNRLGRRAGLLYTARLEAWPLGAFDDFVEGDLQRRTAPRLAIGANVGYNQRTNRPRSTTGTPYPGGDVDYLHAGADGVFKWRGLSVTSEVMYRRAQTSATNDAVPRSGWGAYLQGGYLLTTRTEITARISRLDARGATDPTFADANEAGVGVSRYLYGHDLKFQGDAFRVTDPARGRRATQLRVQLQLFY